MSLLMEKTCLGRSSLIIEYDVSVVLTLISTPYGLDESLPNDERGIFHIEDAEYWAFYDLEYVHAPSLHGLLC